jgi:3-deoxy-D-manno-octulosonic-acid transferase
MLVLIAWLEALVNSKMRGWVLFNVMRQLYSFITFLALPFIFLRLFIRSFKLAAYRQRWPERLGLFKNPHLTPEGLWVHAVSVGEVVAAMPLINALQAKYPALPITVTTTTPTGSQRLRQALGSKVFHVYIPYDLPWLLNRFIGKIEPSCLIIMETELWPNLLDTCTKHKIPVIIANARISDKSLNGYPKIKFFVHNMLQQVACVAAQSKLDAERFLLLGAAPTKVQISGNLKYDVQLPLSQQQLGRDLKNSLGARLVWVVASTHPGEEEIILEAFKIVRSRIPHCLLILVPRHPDRFDEIAKLLDKNMFNYRRRTQNAVIETGVEILLGDTMGELALFYAAADLAFVAGSLVPIGGHNLLEPVALGVPTMTGPYTSNFKEITEKLLAAKALRLVNDASQLVPNTLELLAERALRQQMSANGLTMVEQNRGAVTKVVNIVASFLSQAQQQTLGSAVH